ncbi:MAG: succinate--CoA ligase subunit alpha [Rhodospirillales bacterium]|nr:succinate--CoA ligase subunit alpha [Rhodospirillales bacterium]
MAILVGPETRVICQGMTGRAGSFHVARMIEYGTKVVGGVAPGKGGMRHLDLPVFDSVAEAVEATGANATIVFVPPPNAAEAILEAIHAQMPLVVCVTERIPLLDMVRVRQALEGTRTRLVGPNSQGILVPRVAQLGVMSTTSASSGGIGIASRSASLTSEIVAQVTRAGLGQSTTVGIGGDPVHGMSLADCVALFLDDLQTHGVILIGEIGGSAEEEAAQFLVDEARKGRKKYEELSKEVRQGRQRRI